MALGNFWERIRSLYRRRQPVMPTTTTPTQQFRTPVVSPQPVIAPPTETPAGPLDYASIIKTIHEAGRLQRLLQITYDGSTRLVEPYSFREKAGGRLFFGYCSIHQRIHSFRPEKISSIEITNQIFAPRWEIEL